MRKISGLPAIAVAKRLREGGPSRIRTDDLSPQTTARVGCGPEGIRTLDPYIANVVL